MDRGYYQTHLLTLAQHPSETEQRLMIRLLTFGMQADGALEFGKGLSSEEPDLWRRDLTGQIELWIEIGQPDEQSLRRACGKAQQVIVYTYSGNSAQLWWTKISTLLERCKNLTVIDLNADSCKALATMAQKNMQVHCFIQDGQVQMMSDTEIVPVEMTVRMAAR